MRRCNMSVNQARVRMSLAYLSIEDMLGIQYSAWQMQEICKVSPFPTCLYLGAKKALLVSSVSALLARKMSDLWEHSVKGRMAQNVKVEETVCVADVSAIQQRVEKVTMVTSVNAMMNTVRSSRINCAEVEFQSFSYYLLNHTTFWLNTISTDHISHIP